MAISLGIYSNGNASSKTVSIDFIADFLASSSNGVSQTTRYFVTFNIMELWFKKFLTKFLKW